jgi:DNA-binding response OmpR family regulator
MATILCIEDVPELREDIAEELEEAGYDILQAGDGKEGLEMILKHKPDLVLCDISMPKMSGLQLLREVRGNYPLFAEMPIILLSALADRERVLEGLREGADAYLTKPIDFELLLIRVQTSLRQMARIKHKHEDVLVLDI